MQTTLQRNNTGTLILSDSKPVVETKPRKRETKIIAKTLTAVKAVMKKTARPKKV
jgi:hypothetical protein